MGWGAGSPQAATIGQRVQLALAAVAAQIVVAVAKTPRALQRLAATTAAARLGIGERAGFVARATALQTIERGFAAVARIHVAVGEARRAGRNRARGADAGQLRHARQALVRAVVSAGRAVRLCA